MLNTIQLYISKPPLFQIPTPHDPYPALLPRRLPVPATCYLGVVLRAAIESMMVMAGAAPWLCSRLGVGGLLSRL